MAGNGSRFTSQGYQHPKPFIPVNGKPMIKRVVESLLLFEHEHIFVGKAEHLAYYDMDKIFPHLKFRTIPMYFTTEGAALTVEAASAYFGADEDFLIINSDQLFHYNNHEVEEVRNSGVDGNIWCFKGTGTNWSYARLGEDGYVTEVAEKKQISEYATGGMYYWKSFRNYQASLKRMMEANDRVNNEFYVAPVYNYMEPGQKVSIRMLDDIDQLGTPEELRAYENKIRLP